MTLAIQLTDTHILPPGKVLYNQIDTALHLRETVKQINRMRPRPDVLIVTGDVAERGDKASYLHFLELTAPLKMPVYVVPGNHDRPQTMAEVFEGTTCFPVTDVTYQYAVEDLPFRILGINSRRDGSELPEFDEKRSFWLRHQLELSDKPTLIALHHPPMVTGIEFIDMGGSEWFQEFRSILADHEQVKLVICGHCHTDLSGRVGRVPVYMAPANSHRLIANRGIDSAPSSIIAPTAPTLHHFIDGEFLSGSHCWPETVEEDRIDKVSGLSWDVLKRNMWGTKS